MVSSRPMSHFFRNGSARMGLFICVALVAACATAQDLKVPEGVVFKSIVYRDGGPPNTWTLDYAMPSNPAAPVPAIVMIHGGGWVEGDKSSFDRYCVDFAGLGYFCATVNYRLSGTAPFPAAVEDCRCALRWLCAHAGELSVDSNRIGLYGNSAGGHLALLLAMAGNDSDFRGDGPWQDQAVKIQCAASDSGPVNLDCNVPGNDGLKGIIDKFLAGAPDTFRDRMAKASPITYVRRDTPPLLLLYGCDDAQVTIGPVDDFVAKLREAGDNTVTYIRLAGVNHCPFSLAKVPYTRAIIEDFYARTLGRVARQN